MSEETCIHQKTPTKETYSLQIGTCNQTHLCQENNMCQKRPVYVKQTYKKDPLPSNGYLQPNISMSGKQRMSKETCIHQKRPTKETHSLRTAPATQHICVRKTSYVKRDLYTSKETYKRDPLLSKSAPADKHICFRKIKLFQRTSGSFGGIQGLLRNVGPSLNNSLLLGGEYRADKLLPSRSALWGGYGQ